MRVTKKDLQEQLKQCREEKWRAESLLGNYRKEVDELKSKVEETLQASTDKSELLQLIMNVLAGASSPVSKTEVLIDLFPEVQEITGRKEETKGSHYIHHMHRRF